MPSDFVHLPYAQLETPEVSTEWMRYFRQRVEEELRRTNNTLNRVDQNTIAVVEELATVPTPAAASFYSISAAEGTIYVQLSCSETVTGFELCATTVSGTRKQIMYAESNATTGRGHFEFPSLEAVFLWGRTVNKGTWAEARSGWTQYLATTALQFTNILTDTITGGLGQVANFVEMTVNPFAAYNRLTYNTNRIHSTGDILVHGYWDSSVVQMGSHGVRIRYQHKGPSTLSPQTYDGFLFMVPDTAMDGTPATWNGKKCYFAGFTKVGASVYALIALYTCVAPMDHYNSPYYFGVDGAPTYLDISTDLVTAGYCDADGFGAFEIRVEDNTFYIYGGASYGTLLASATDTTYLLGSARNGIGFLKPDQSWIDDEIALTIDHVNYVTGPDANSVDPGVVAIDRGGTNNNSYTTDQFLEYDSTSGRIQSSGYGPSSFAPSPHDILSTHHGDTTAAAVVRGDMIAGIGATPKWERVALGAQNTIWAAGATEPAWTTRAALFGSGTDNYIPKFVTGATPTFGDSLLTETVGPPALLKYDGHILSTFAEAAPCYIGARGDCVVIKADYDDDSKGSPQILFSFGNAGVQAGIGYYTTNDYRFGFGIGYASATAKAHIVGSITDLVTLKAIGAAAATVDIAQFFENGGKGLDVTKDGYVYANTKLQVDHIAEYTGSHGIALDNKLLVDHIGELTGSHNIVFDNTITTTTLLADHIGEKTGSHGLFSDSNLTISTSSQPTLYMFEGGSQKMSMGINTNDDLVFIPGTGKTIYYAQGVDLESQFVAATTGKKASFTIDSLDSQNKVNFNHNGVNYWILYETPGSDLQIYSGSLGGNALNLSPTGVLRTGGGYKSADGTAGATGSVSVRKGDDSGALTITYKDGLITSIA